MKRLITLLFLALVPTAHATQYSFTKIDDSPIGPYNGLASPMMNSLGWVVYAARLRGGDYRSDVIVSDGVTRFIARPD